MLRFLEVDADRTTNVSGSELPLSRLLAALAGILRDSTGRFEATSDLIAQLVVARETATGGDIIVALQEFDRLRQEFDAIGGILTRCARATEHPAANGHSHALHDLIAEIPVIDFKSRLALRLAEELRATSPADANFVAQNIS